VSVFFSILGPGFGLVCKVVVEIQKKFYSFHLHGLATWTKHFR
jgi:hypothetical protein